MIIAHYSHRLPADHDVDAIRARAQERGPLWDAVPELCFKAFLLRQKGRLGAIAHDYSSLYLWRQDEAFRDFLVGGRYRTVTDAFGRAEIRTRFALDARRGDSRQARFATIEQVDIALDADLTAVFALEMERNRAQASVAGIVAATVGVDTRAWRLTRVLLSEREPLPDGAGTAYEILYLARPLLETLADGAAD